MGTGQENRAPPFRNGGRRRVSRAQTRGTGRRGALGSIWLGALSRGNAPLCGPKATHSSIDVPSPTFRERDPPVGDQPLSSLGEQPLYRVNVTSRASVGIKRRALCHRSPNSLCVLSGDPGRYTDGIVCECILCKIRRGRHTLSKQADDGIPSTCDKDPSILFLHLALCLPEHSVGIPTALLHSF